MTKCKLQMMATSSYPLDFDRGPMLCAGLTLRHYSAFAHCQSLAALDARYDAENPLYKTLGIHVLVSQNRVQELILGDSHEYGWDVSPFERADINTLILNYLATFTHLKDMSISRYWQGVYAKKTGATEWVHALQPQTTLVNGLGGAGMTLSFGLAESLWANF